MTAGTTGATTGSAAGASTRTTAATTAGTTAGTTAAAQRIDELRLSVDALDRQIVGLLAQRTLVVRELTAFKTDEETVRSPGRVAQVIEKVRSLAVEEGMPPGIAESVYRTLITELTDLQMELLAERRASAGRAAPAGAREGTA
ncbi:chorismate mutase [Streptomyces sp. NPDC059819]|uniref:chorismate mutase n=1 Tax=Streptomyces sp. NPDC059819 TaxID=3346963 RepID=UPI0036606307